MGDRFAATLTEPIISTSPGTTLGTIHSLGTTRRGFLYESIFSQAGAPADTVLTYELGRTTTLGTEGGAVVPTPLDSLGPVAILDAGEGTYTLEPTYPAAQELLHFDLNQRATFRFVAAPGGELVIPHIVNAGLGLLPFSALYTGVARWTAHWEE